MDACAIVWVVYQEANAIDKLIHIKNPPHFFQCDGFFLSFLDFVQQVARYVFYRLKCGRDFINFGFGGSLPCWCKRPSLVPFEFTQIYIFSISVDACTIVRVVYQEANAIDKLIHIKNPPHFFLVWWIFPLFLDFVQQVARYVFYQLKCGHNFINFSFGVRLCFGNRICT